MLAALGVIAGDGIRDLLNFHVRGVANNVTDLFAHAAAGAQLPPGKQEARARKQQGHAAHKILEQPGPVTAALRKGFRQPIHGFRQVGHHGNGKNHAQNRQGNAPALTFILAAALILAGGLLRVIRLCAVRVLVDLDPLLGFVRGFFRSLRVRIDGADGVRLAGLPVVLAPALRRRDFAHSQQMVDDHHCNANRPRRKAECDYDHPPGDLEHTIPFVVFLAGVLPGAAGLVIQRLLPRTVLVFVIGVRVIRVWHSFSSHILFTAGPQSAAAVRPKDNRCCPAGRGCFCCTAHGCTGSPSSGSTRQPSGGCRHSGHNPPSGSHPPR